MKYNKIKHMLRTIFMLSILASLVFAFSLPAEASAYDNTYANTGNQRKDIIGVAETQLGYTEGWNNKTKYGDWYGLPNSPWCAMFISWCARQANIPTSVLANSACASPQSGYFNIAYKSGKSYTPRAGDLFFTTNRSHVGLVYYVEGNSFWTIEGNSNTNGSSEGTSVVSLKRKTSDYDFGIPNYNETHVHEYLATGYEAAHPHKVYKKCSCGDFYYTGETKSLDSCQECTGHIEDTTYSSYLPIYAYSIATARTSVYDASGSKLENRYIESTDLCIIKKIYQDGWAYVRYPSSAEASGYFEAYVKLDAFIDGGYQPCSWTSPRSFTAYRRTDLSTQIGTVYKDDVCLLVDLDKENYTVQLLYPIAEGSKLGWAAVRNFA